jgi:TonB-dependent receptor
MHPRVLPAQPASPRLPSVLRAALAASGLLLGAALSAADAGTIAGRVVDDRTKLALGGARVRVEGTALETYADRFGNFAIPNVPAGPVQVRFDYVGYTGFALPATVQPDGTFELDAHFGQDGEVIVLQPFVVEGAAVGQARAINQQHAATTLSNFVAADEIGRFPDQNAAEALQRMPGISLYRDQGEGRFAVVRGINYTLGSVTLNGMKVASPEIGDRGIALDVLPADALTTIEVNKVPTPDRDAEGLGGSVDLRTKSAFDHDNTYAALTAQGQYSNLADKFSGKFSSLFSTVSADGRFGFLVAPTWQTRKFGSFNYEIDDGWTDKVETSDGDVELDHAFLQDIAFREYEIERKRYGASTTLEFKPDAESYYYVRGTYNRFTDTENRWISYIPFVQGAESDIDNLTELTESSATVAKVRRYDRRLRMREKDQDLLALLAGGERRFGAWKVDGQFGWSRGHEEKPGEVEVAFRRSTRDGTFRYTFDAPYDIAVEQLAGASITDPASYNQFDELTRAVDEGTETETGGLLNARYDFDGATPGFVKFGTVVRRKTKDSESEVTSYTPPSSFTFASLAGETGDYPYGFAVPQIAPEKLRAAFLDNLAAFDAETEYEDSNYDDWNSGENVVAAYLMGGVTVGATQFTGGLRVEHTRFETTGKELEFDADGDFAGTRPVQASRDYTDWLPGLHVKHEFAKNVVLRAAWSNSLSRPSFGDSAARRNINREDEELTVGNPDLEELTSTNFDVSLDWYLSSLGLVSVAGFHKEIRHFGYETEIAEDPAFPDFEVTSFLSDAKGHISGVELGYQQQFRSLPAPFDGLGFLANLTLADSSADYGALLDDVETPFVGQSKRVGNLALTYEKGRFFGRLAVNFRSERLREDEAIQDQLWVDDSAQLDLTLNYKLTDNFELFAEGLNLTNEPFRVFQRAGDGRKRFVQFEEYDWSVNFGVRWHL